MERYKKLIETTEIKLKGKDEERFPMGIHKADNHFAVFYNGILSGLAWFGKMNIFNNKEYFIKKYSKSDYQIVNPENEFKNSRATDAFEKEFHNAKQYINDALDYYNENKNE